MHAFLQSVTLLFALLNPFLVIVYLFDVLQKLSPREFVGVMLRGSAISVAVFWVFAVVGDRVFSVYAQVEFASFQIFGGLVFLVIGLEFVFKGPTAIQMLRGDSSNLAGAIAMPVFIGPGTISASVVLGRRHEALTACAAVLAALALSVTCVLLLKALHDYVRPRNEPLVERYIEVTGRIAALFIGTVAVEMILVGVDAWLDKM